MKEHTTFVCVAENLAIKVCEEFIENLAQLYLFQVFNINLYFYILYMSFINYVYIDLCVYFGTLFLYEIYKY